MTHGPFDYDGRTFRPRFNTESGEVTGETLFTYHQRGDVIWATYEGGHARFGTLVGTVDADGNLDFRYAHVNTEGEIMTGTCRSTREQLPDGRLRMHERWQWTSGDQSQGESILEEVREEP